MSLCQGLEGIFFKKVIHIGGVPASRKSLNINSLPLYTTLHSGSAGVTRAVIGTHFHEPIAHTAPLHLCPILARANIIVTLIIRVVVVVVTTHNLIVIWPIVIGLHLIVLGKVIHA